MASTTKLKVTELDFDLIKTSLKDYLKAQSRFVDYDFEGSGMAVLLDLLSYNTHYNAFYTNMIANEMFLDSTTLRSSTISLAKQLGYTPRSTLGARAKVSLTFSPDDLLGDNLGTSVALPKGSVFLTEINNKTFGYVTTSSYTAQPTANTTGGYWVSSTSESGVVPYTIPEVEITQGIYSSIQYVYNTQISNQRFIIPNTGVDISTITVLVTDAISGTSGANYTLAADYAALTSGSKVFFVQETLNNKYEIYFGDGNIGFSPINGNIIDITYVISEGLAGNDATIFESDPIKSPLYGISNDTTTYDPTVTLLEKAAGGAPQEDLTSIKYLAPRNYEAQNRAVTTDDYVVKVLSDYPQIDAVRCWGGEDNIPPDYGKVYLAIKPVEGYILSNADKDKIKQDVLKSRNVITVAPVIVDPSYLYLIVDTIIKWDSRLTPLTGSTLKAGVVNEIVNWGQNNLEKFETYFRYSVLLQAIDNYNPGIVNNETSIKLRTEIIPGVGISETHDIKFFNPLYHPHVGHKGALSSSSFEYAGYTNCVLSDLDGVVYIYGVGGIGENVIVSSNAGTIDYDTGQVILSGFQPSTVHNGGVLSIIANPEHTDIVPNYNQLIAIKSSDLTVTMLDDSSATSGTVGIIRAAGQTSSSGSIY
jgi:hypothetical protein